MYATAAKPLSHKAFSRGNPVICGYETIPSKKVKRFHTGKWSLCDCIHLLRLVEKTLSTLIQTNETKKSTQIDAFLKIDANAQRQEYKKAS